MHHIISDLFFMIMNLIFKNFSIFKLGTLYNYDKIKLIFIKLI